MESAIAIDDCYMAGTACLGRTKLARAEAQLQAERVRRSRLEYLLREELAQELAGISLLVAALRSPSRSPLAADLALQQITDLLSSSIGRCCDAVQTPLRARS